MTDETTHFVDPGSDSREPDGTILANGTRIGRLVVLGAAGEGGMGRVYAAYDSILDRRICLKFLKSFGDTESDQLGNQRLLDEARALAQVSHPNILPIFDVGEFEGQVYLVTEFVDGWTLADWIKDRSPESDRILAAFREAGSGLAAAHAGGIVHRDFKPDNIMIGHDDRTRVMDFGLATSSRTLDSGSDGYGTPRFMAPELLAGHAATAASDQYAYCLSLSTCLGADIETLRESNKAIEGLPLTERQRAAVRRGLSAQPGQRFADMPALLNELHVKQAGKRWPWLLAAASVSVIAAVLIVREVQQVPPCSGSDELLAKSWNPDISARLHEAFIATGSPVASRGLSMVDETLQSFAKDWSESRTTACKATVVRHEQSQVLLDRRMLCFDRRLRERDAALVVLTSADAKTVAETSDILSTIQPVSLCNDLEAMSSLRTSSVPAEQREQYAQIDGQVALAEAQFEAGRYEAAAQTAGKAAEQAAGIDNASLHARVSYVVGITAEALDKLELSELELGKAFRSSVAIGDELLTAKALGRLMFVASSRRMDRERALHWIDWKVSLAPWFSHNREISALLDMHHGLALEPLEQMEDAELLLQRSWQESSATLGPQAPQTLRARGNYAAALLMQGKMAEGAVELEALIPDFRATLGEQHPNLAILQRNLAIAYTKIDRIDEALELERQIILIGEANLGVNHSDVGSSRVAYAESLLDAGRPDLAAEQARRADTIFIESLGEDHVWRLVAATLLAKAQHLQGDSAQALTTLDDAMLRGKVGDLPIDQQAFLWLARTRMLVALNRSNEARSDLNRVRELIPELGVRQSSAQAEIDEVAASIQ